MASSRRLAPIVFIGLLVVLGGGLFWWFGARQTPDRAFADGIDRAIGLSDGYLTRQCGDDGRFVYRINLDPAVVLEPRYNIVRHAGTIYAMAMCQRYRPRDETRQALARAIEFLKRESISPVPDRKELLAVWSRPGISGRDVPVEAKLGGTGLGLAALMSFEQIQPGTTSLDDLRRLGRFLVYMQKEDGSFYSRYFPRSGRDDYWTSLYYPGEAALGLLMLHEEDPSPVWLDAAAKTIGYLARSRAGRETVEADHWALLATARLLPQYDRCRQVVAREAVVHHAAQICRSILSEKPPWPDDEAEHGCFTHDGRTCPTATRVEGLLAALTFLPEDEYRELREQITVAVTDAVAFLLRTQLQEGPYAGAIPRRLPPSPAILAELSPSERERVGEVRIDYVQHVLSGLIQYRRMFCRPGRRAVGR